MSNQLEVYKISKTFPHLSERDIEPWIDSECDAAVKRIYKEEQKIQNAMKLLQN
jgi:hypothetical protein